MSAKRNEIKTFESFAVRLTIRRLSGRRVPSTRSSGALSCHDGRTGVAVPAAFRPTAMADDSAQADRSAPAELMVVADAA